jgi:hypothetical protein
MIHNLPGKFAHRNNAYFIWHDLCDELSGYDTMAKTGLTNYLRLSGKLKIANITWVHGYENGDVVV